MNTTENTTDITTDNTARPIGFWLKTVDRLLAHEFETAFESEGIGRREWRMLNAIDSDRVAPEFAERFQRRGSGKLRTLVDRGWVEAAGDSWILTDAGREAKDRLSAIVTGIRQKVAGAVSEEDFATTVASLEQIALTLGFDPSAPRGPRHGDRGFRGHHRGHGGPRRGHGRRFGRPGRTADADENPTL